MALEESEQRLWKRRLVLDALARIGGMREVEVGEVIATPATLGYRNKAEFTLGLDRGGRRVLGLHGSSPTRELIDVDRCLLQSAAANRLLATLRRELLDPASPAGLFRAEDPLRWTLRSSRFSGELLVAVRDRDAALRPELEVLANRLRAAHAELCGVVLLISPRGRRGGTRAQLLAGREWIEECLAGFSFRLPAASFLQVNLEAAEMLVARMLEQAGPVHGVDVLELYGGVGVYALALAQRGARVVSCEADAAAVEAARESARRAGLSTVRFEQGDVLRVLRASMQGAWRPGLIVANPPRTGLGRGVAEAMAALRPLRILLIACDPATLARDARRLGMAGYALRRVVPVDLFPQTAHVEAIALLDRLSGASVR
jgi:23S rRNA (uracil1939-C5)-methyltransferase